MANREVADAHSHAGGCGYLVIGAEPGSINGVTEIDPADLDQAVQAYLSPGGPSWSAAYARSAERSVLVIMVEPPAAGDRIRTLQESFSRI